MSSEVTLPRPETIPDLKTVLTKELGMEEKVLLKLVTFEEKMDELLVHCRYIADKSKFGRLIGLCEKLGAKRETDTKPYLTLFKIPIKLQKPTEPQVTPIAKSPETPQAVSVTTDNIMTTNIPLSKLERRVFSPRQEFDKKYIQEMADSIRLDGQHKPIIVRPHPTKPDFYQIIDGESRCRALDLLRYSMVRAEVRQLSDEDAYVLAMKVNQEHGKLLSEMEEALHIQALIEKFNYSQEDVAKRFKRSQQWVSYRLSLLEKTHPEVREKLTTRVVKPSQAEEIAELPIEEQPKVAEKVEKEGLSARETEALVHAIKEAPTPEAKAYVLEQPIETIIEKQKEAKVEAEGGVVAKTPEDVETFFAESKPVEDWQEDFACPECGHKLKVDWKTGRVTWD